MPTPSHHHGLGWRPDLPDHRDLVYAAPPGALPPLVDLVDLRSKLPACYDQGQLGSCTANAIAGGLQFLERLEGRADVTPSRLFIYWLERQAEGTILADAGAAIRDGIKAVVHQGFCPESEWPYVISRFTQTPPARCFSDALKDTVTSYRRLRRLTAQMAACLAEGFPFVFGFTVYESFMSDQVAASGRVPMPGPAERTVGGHAVLAVGYDLARKVFIVRNSWGSSWGDGGHCYMPFAYLASRLASDFWTMRRTTS